MFAVEIAWGCNVGGRVPLAPLFAFGRSVSSPLPSRPALFRRAPYHARPPCHLEPLPPSWCVAAAGPEDDDDRPDLVAQILDEAARMDGSRPFQLVEEDEEDDSGSDSESESDGEADLAVDWNAALLYQEGFAADAEQHASLSNRVVVDIDPASAQRYARQGLDFANRAIESSKQGARVEARWCHVACLGGGRRAQKGPTM